MIAIRKEESDTVGNDKGSDEDTIVRGIFKKELLKIFPKFSEKNPENGNEFRFVRDVMPTLHVHGAVSGTVRDVQRGQSKFSRSRKRHTVRRGKLPEYKINARHSVIR